jgi:hypothetical protein
MRERGHPGVRGTASRDMLWSLTIRAALIAGAPWLDVFCLGCGTSRAIDLRKVNRQPLVRGHPGAGVAVLLVPRGGANAEDPRFARAPACGDASMAAAGRNRGRQSASSSCRLCPSVTRSGDTSFHRSGEDGLSLAPGPEVLYLFRTKTTRLTEARDECCR